MRSLKGAGADAARFIEQQIDAGIWVPGQKLPTERELVARFGIARNTLRKSLEPLEVAGKIVRHVGRGTFVADAGPAADSAPDSLALRIAHASPAEIMDVRLMLEPQAGELTAARATADDFAAMEECLRGCEAAASIAEFEEWDGRLHRRIVAAARIELLVDIYDAINNARQLAAWGALKVRSLTPDRRALYQRQHGGIVAALRDRDPDLARDAIRGHLLAVKASFGGL